MPITINWATRIISIPQSDLLHVSGALYELDVDAFRRVLKDIEDSEDGMPFPDTHRHAPEAALSGVTYARQVEIVNGYTIAFEPAAPYTVRCVGANHNIADVTNFDGSVSLIIGNAAGLIVTTGGAAIAPTAQQIRDALKLAPTAGAPAAGSVDQTLADLPAQVLSAANAAPIDANIKRVNDIAVDGAGTSGAPWGPA